MEICRELYNMALQERREAYKISGKSINYLEQANQLPAIKASSEDVRGVHSQVLQDVLKRVAMEGFYRRVKKGEQGGYPRFKGKIRYELFTYPQISLLLAQGLAVIVLGGLTLVESLSGEPS